MCRSRRPAIVPKKLTAKTTQTTAIAMSIGHSSSAYSLPCVKPSGRVTAAATMIACQPQKWNQLSASLNMPRLAQPLRRVVDAGEDRVAGEGEDRRVGVQRAQPAERQPRGGEVEGRVGQLQGDDHADEHADDAPQQGRPDEHPDDRVVVGEAFQPFAHDLSVVFVPFCRETGRAPQRARRRRTAGLARARLRGMASRSQSALTTTSFVEGSSSSSSGGTRAGSPPASTAAGEGPGTARARARFLEPQRPAEQDEHAGREVARVEQDLARRAGEPAHVGEPRQLVERRAGIGPVGARYAARACSSGGGSHRGRKSTGGRGGAP